MSTEQLPSLTIQYGKEKITVFPSGKENIPLSNENKALSVDFTHSLTELKEQLLAWVNQLHVQQTDEPQERKHYLQHIDEIKLILNGKILNTSEVKSIESLFSMFPTGKNKGLKIILIANPDTKPLEEQLILQKLEEETRQQKLAKRRKFLHKGGFQTQKKGPILYGFQQITTLSNLPNESQAKEILQRLANDSGIIAVMNKYKFTVNELCELMPDGYVGVSDVCVMGLNQNHGQKILLRLRTDDLKGFRKYLSIKKVLYHELAHNIYSEHDGNFYILMRAIEKDANELKWETTRGFALDRSAQPVERYEGGGGYDEEEEKEEQTVFTLGGEKPEITVPAEEMAREAALLRFHRFQLMQQNLKYNQYEKQGGENGEFSSVGKEIEGKEIQETEEKQQQKSTEDGAMEITSSEEERESDLTADKKIEMEEEEITVVDFIPAERSKDSEKQKISTKAEKTQKEEDSEGAMKMDEIIVNNSSEKAVQQAQPPVLPPPAPKELSPEQPNPVITSELVNQKKEEIILMFEDTIAMILSDETLVSTIEKVLAIRDIVMVLLSEVVTGEKNNNYEMERKYNQLKEMISLFSTIIANIQVRIQFFCFYWLIFLFEIPFLNRAIPMNQNIKKSRSPIKCSKSKFLAEREFTTSRFLSSYFYLRVVNGLETGIQILHQVGFEENSSDKNELQYKKNDYGLLYLVKSLLESILLCLERKE
jgi:hypothetical protein